MRWIVWWFAIFAAYCITATAKVGAEIVAGALIAALATMLIARSVRGQSWDVRVPWTLWGELASLPPRMFADALAILAQIVRAWCTGDELAGHFIRQAKQPGDAGREAIEIIAISAAPNTLVTDIDDFQGEYVIHQLLPK